MATPELWQRARSVFDALLAVEEPERAAHFNRLCRDDADLRSAVEALIAHDRDDSFLASPLGSGSPPPGQVPDGAAVAERYPGSRLGPYRLREEIGRGGAGVVFRALRDDDAFEKEVAVKVLHRALDADAARRFRQERQILAHLEHPGIARLLDGGTTPDGAPYIVMELVEGRPITDLCDAERLTVRERLDLFRQVCEAVEHAHRNLVVHRDLKPSNILVTGDGQVKLLDFGVAKLSGEAMATQTHQRWLTPAYASPEQLLGRPVTTASDVYSLGVLLYELLAGQRPFAAGSGDLLTVSRRPAPPPPSSAVVGDPDERTAAARGVSRRRLLRQLAGDLDAVTLRALRDEPGWRYAGVGGLRRDVERHLAGHPVEAYRGSFLYRARRFVRRHAVASTAAGMTLVMISGFAAMTARQSSRLADERDLAERERRRAETVSDAIVDLFQVMDPISGHTYHEAATAVLDQGTARVITTLEGEPEMQDTLRLTLGGIYRDLADYGKADELLDQAHTGRRMRLGPQHPAVAESYEALGTLRTEQGRHDEAERLFRAALGIRRLHVGEDSRTIAGNLDSLGNVLLKKGEYAEAEDYLRRAIDMSRRLGDDGSKENANRLNNLGRLLGARGEVRQARTALQESLAIYRRVFGARHLNVAAVLNNLAVLESNASDAAAAEPLLREALAIRRRLQGEDHPDVATVRQNLAALLHQAGDYGAAEELYREALAMDRSSLGEEHPHVATDLNNLGILLRESDRLEEARRLLDESLRIRLRVLGEEHSDVASTLNNLGLVALDLGDSDTAEASFRRALAIQRRSLGESHWLVGNSLNNLAKAALARGEARAAESLAREALVVLKETLPPGHWRSADADGVLGAALARLGSTAEAERLRRSLGVIEKAKGPRSRYTRDAAARLAGLSDARQ